MAVVVQLPLTRLVDRPVPNGSPRTGDLVGDRDDRLKAGERGPLAFSADRASPPRRALDRYSRSGLMHRAWGGGPNRVGPEAAECGRFRWRNALRPGTLQTSLVPKRHNGRETEPTPGAADGWRRRLAPKGLKSSNHEHRYESRTGRLPVPFGTRTGSLVNQMMRPGEPRPGSAGNGSVLSPASRVFCPPASA